MTVVANLKMDANLSLSQKQQFASNSNEAKKKKKPISKKQPARLASGWGSWSEHSNLAVLPNEDRLCEVTIVRREALGFQTFLSAIKAESHFITQVLDTWIQSIFNTHTQQLLS